MRRNVGTWTLFTHYFNIDTPIIVGIYARFIIPVVELQLQKVPAIEKMTTNKEMSVMKQFLDVSRLARPVHCWGSVGHLFLKSLQYLQSIEEAKTNS